MNVEDLNSMLVMTPRFGAQAEDPCPRSWLAPTKRMEDSRRAGMATLLCNFSVADSFEHARQPGHAMSDGSPASPWRRSGAGKRQESRAAYTEESSSASNRFTVAIREFSFP